MTRDDLGIGAALVVSLAAILWFVSPAWGVGPVVGAGTCALTWEAPTTNVNGSPLTDLARYEVQVGTAPGTFPTPPVAVGASGPAPAPGTVVAWPCVGLADGQRYARVRAVDLAGNPSAWSTEVPFVFDAVAPSAPANLRVNP